MKLFFILLFQLSSILLFSQSIQNDWLETKENVVSIDLWRYFEVNNVNENGDSIGDVELWRLGKDSTNFGVTSFHEFYWVREDSLFTRGLYGADTALYTIEDDTLFISNVRDDRIFKYLKYSKKEYWKGR